MKSVQWMVVTVVTVASMPMLAQQGSANGQQNAQVTAGGAQVNDSSSGSARGSLGRGQGDASGAADNSASVTGPRGSSASASGAMNGSAAGEMRPVSGELQSRLSSKTAKAGDAVVVKTTEKMKTAEGVEIPRGSRLVGHVTSAQAHVKGEAGSQLGVVFDRVELKGGQNIGIHSMIESVSPPAANVMAAADADTTDPAMVGGPMGAQGNMAGAARSPGGMLGSGRGAVDGTVNGVGDTVDRTGTGLHSAADGTMDAAGNMSGRVAGDATGMARGTTQAAANTTGSIGTHATAIPGVMLRGDATGAASGTLTAAGKNVELESGTQVVLGIAVQRQ